ncbi:hypothetical protein H7F33_18970 [Pedobacter sp. PAMC26386]|nr:hypothetical protein H7F33_18970 [Pedobacter sp. PAMC26386]
MWGEHPWDNDRAPDWFGVMMDKTGLAGYVRETLSTEINKDSAEVLRTAAFCLIQFGHIYVWPHEGLKGDLTLGIAALQQVLTDNEYCYSEEITADIRAELLQLEERKENIIG